MGILAQDGIDIVDSLQTGITDFFAGLFGFLPNLIGFLLILFIGWRVARIIESVANRLFGMLKLDQYLDRAGIGGPLERAGYADSGRFVAKIVYYTVMLLVIKLAFGALDILALNEPFDQLIEWIPKALVALVLVVVGGLVANVVRELVSGLTTGQSYSNLVTNAAGIGIWLLFGLAALDQAEVASDLVDTVTTAIFASLSLVLVIKFGVGGVWAARDRFWPMVYDGLSRQVRSPDAASAAPPSAAPTDPHQA
jgi:hypothetical protein